MPMPFWVQMLLSLAAFALLVALVAAVWSLRGVAQRAEAVLAIVEQELRPLIGQGLALTEDVRGLTREAGRELERVGVAAGLKRGIDVFVHRLRHQGDHHEQLSTRRRGVHGLVPVRRGGRRR